MKAIPLKASRNGKGPPQMSFFSTVKGLHESSTQNSLEGPRQLARSKQEPQTMSSKRNELLRDPSMFEMKSKESGLLATGS